MKNCKHKALYLILLFTSVFIAGCNKPADKTVDFEPDNPVISEPEEDIEVTIPQACDVPMTYTSVEDFIMGDKMPAFFIPEKLPETAELLDIGFMGSDVLIGYGLKGIDYWLYRNTEYETSARYLYGYFFEGGCEKLSDDFNFKEAMEGNGYLPFDESGNYFYEDIPFNYEDRRDDIIARTLYWEQDNYLFKITLPVEYFKDDSVLQYAKAIKYISDTSPDAVEKYEQRKKEEAEAWKRSMEEINRKTQEIISEDTTGQEPVNPAEPAVVEEAPAPLTEEPVYEEKKFKTLEELTSFTGKAFYIPKNLPETAEIREIIYSENNYLKIVYALEDIEYLNNTNSVKFYCDINTSAVEKFNELTDSWILFGDKEGYFEDEMHILKNEPISRTIYWKENNMTFQITLPIEYFKQDIQWNKVMLINN
jgi:hypothetical protein